MLETAQLLASELVTNAVLHAGSDVEVVVRRLPDRLRVEVADGNPSTPLVREHAPQAMTGRGLTLVAELAGAWGIDERAGGKAVWFELLL